MEKHLTEWKIVLELLSPLQIGAGTLGMVEKSELFIPGRLLWAVLTAGFTRSLVKRPDKDDYDEIGSQLAPWESNFSTLFPSFDRGASCWLPVFERNRRVWHRADNSLKIDAGNDATMSEAEIEARLFSGLSGNATDPQLMATDDGSLHETDLITPFVRTPDNALQSLMFCGRLRLPGRVSLSGEERLVDAGSVRSILDRSRLGGGRKRGRGAISVYELEELGDVSPSDLSCQEYDEHRTLLLSSSHQVMLHQDAAAVSGRARLAVYREHSRDKGSGGGFSRAVLCWQVGTLIETDCLIPPTPRR